MAEISTELIRTIQEAVGVKTLEIDGREYVNRELRLPPQEPMPGALGVTTLAGLVDYVNTASDGERARFRAVHVVNYRSVQLLGDLTGRHQTRPVFVNAQVPVIKGFDHFGEWLSQEAFMLWLQGGFVQDDELKNVLRIVGTLQSEAVRTASDDGVTQKVATKRGIVLGGEEALPNPVAFRPFRTFPDVDQPSVKFVLRVECEPGKAPTILLAETADVRWMAETAAKVKTYLDGKEMGIPIIG